MLPLVDKASVRESFPVATLALVGANVAVFLDGSGHALVPYRFLRAPDTSPLECMFMHAGWVHLVGNMLFLWVFGPAVEARLGRVRFLLAFAVCGLVGGLGQAFISPTSHAGIVGASGAIAGTMATYGRFRARAPITVLNPILPLWLIWGPVMNVPAWLIIAEFFAGSLISNGNVASMAHLGGFVTGLLMASGEA